MNDPKKQAQYIELYNLFDESLVNHIPNKLPNGLISTSFSKPDYYSKSGKHFDMPHHSFLSLVTNISSHNKYEKLKNEYVESGKYSFSTEDTCFAIIRTKKTNIDINYTSTCDKLHPIPELAIVEYTYKDKKWNRIKNGQVIILDYKSGNYTGESNIIPNQEMPTELQNGYSRGITFNDQKQTLNYWLIIW